MNDILTKLWNDTVRNENPEGKARVYLVTPEGETAHGVVGGSSLNDVKEKVRDVIPMNAEIVSYEPFEEGSISHPLRG